MNADEEKDKHIALLEARLTQSDRFWQLAHEKIAQKDAQIVALQAALTTEKQRSLDVAQQYKQALSELSSFIKSEALKER